MIIHYRGSGSNCIFPLNLVLATSKIRDFQIRNVVIPCDQTQTLATEEICKSYSYFCIGVLYFVIFLCYFNCIATAKGKSLCQRSKVLILLLRLLPKPFLHKSPLPKVNISQGEHCQVPFSCIIAKHIQI